MASRVPERRDELCRDRAPTHARPLASAAGRGVAAEEKERAARRAGRGSAVGVKAACRPPAGIPRRAGHEGRDEQDARDGSDVAERRSEAGEPAAPACGDELGEHRVVRRERELVGDVARRRTRRGGGGGRAGAERRPRERARERAVAPAQTSVSPTTQGFRRRDASETAPIQGASSRTTADERLVASE